MRVSVPSVLKSSIYAGGVGPISRSMRVSIRSFLKSSIYAGGVGPISRSVRVSTRSFYKSSVCGRCRIYFQYRSTQGVSLFVCPFVRCPCRLSIRSSIVDVPFFHYPSVHQSVRPSLHSFIRPPVRPSIRPSIRLSIHSTSVRPFLHSSIRPSVCLSVRPSIRSSLRPFVSSVSVCVCVHVCVRLCSCRPILITYEYTPSPPKSRTLPVFGISRPLLG